MKTLTKTIRSLKKSVAAIESLPAPAPLVSFGKVNFFQVKATDWNAWHELKAQSEAIKKKEKKLREKMSLNSETLKEIFGEKERTIIIQDGNGQPLGKASIFFKDSFEMPATWQVRIT